MPSSPLGYNFSLLLRWLARLCAPLSGPSFRNRCSPRSAEKAAQPFFTAD